jgi:sugar lactone lactonase YvrE
MTPISRRTTSDSLTHNSRTSRPAARWVRGLAVMSLLLSVGAVVATQGVARAAGPDPAGTIYVADESTNSIDVFAAGTNGNVAPIRTISGSLTGITGPFGPDDVKVNAAGNIFASNFNGNSITEYAPGASGNVAPICTIAGSNTGLANNDDISLASDGTLYVGNFAGSSPVEVFAPGACGNVSPIRTIAGSSTGLGQVDGLGVDAAGNLYVDNTTGGSVEVFAPGANGNVAPIRTIAGAMTGLSAPDDVVVGFTGQIYVTDGFSSGVNNVLVFAPGANGNVAPIQNISGTNTDLGNPDDLAVDAAGHIFVTDSQSSLGPAVLEYASGATGNVAPIASIAGTTTTLVGPEGVAVAGATMGESATLTSSASASSVGLGGSAHDTATLSGGTTPPTGSLIFKLFGPSDPTCSAAPAYTSPLATVTGDGAYMSPSFTPTAAGTYSWVDLYSGDGHNSPVSTACGDPHETVTVTSTTGQCPPTVKHVFPIGNPRSEIVKVLITGTCLSGATHVMFGGLAATSFSVGYGGNITASPPQQPAGKVDVTVTTPGGTSALNPPADQYTYYLPVVTQVLPNHGSVSGGNTVLIHGFMFSGTPTPTVSFGTGNPSASVVVLNDGSIRALVPPHTSGTVDVQVTAFTGTSLPNSLDHYTYK